MSIALFFMVFFHWQPTKDQEQEVVQNQKYVYIIPKIHKVLIMTPNISSNFIYDLVHY